MGTSYKLKITTPAKIIVYRDRPVRTPVEFIVNKTELDSLRVQLNRLGTKDYTIENIENIGKDLGFTDKDVKEIIGEPVTEEKESNSLLNKLLKEKWKIGETRNETNNNFSG